MPDDAARFLQAPVEQNDPPADRADIVGPGQGLQRGAQRAGTHNGIIVKQQNMLAGRRLHGLIDCQQEAQVAVVPLYRRAFYPCQQLAGSVGRGVIGNHHLNRNGGLCCERFKASVAEFGLIPENQHDRNQGLFGAR